MFKVLNSSKYNISFYLLSIISSIGILAFFLNFNKIVVNIFEVYDFYNLEPNPYYQFSCGLLTFIIITIIFLLFTKNKIFIYGWILKACVTLFVVLLLEYLYPGLDQFSYYVASSYYPDKYASHPFSSGIPAIIQFNSYVAILFGKSLYSMKIVSSFFAFLGLILFYKTYELLTYKQEIKNNLSQYYLFIIPSILIWTSLLGKDSLILFPIGLFVYAYFSFLTKKNLLWFLIILVSLLLAFLVRPWIPLILVFTVLLHNFKLNKFYLFLTPIALILMYIISIKLFQQLNIESFNELFARLGQLQQSFSRGGSKVELALIEDIWDYTRYFIPNAFITLFYPLPFLGTTNIFLWFFSFENLVIFGLIIIYVLPKLIKLIKNYNTRFFLILIFGWLLLYVILSPGNLGTAIRYKVQIIPVIIVLILLSKNYIMIRK